MTGSCRRLIAAVQISAALMFSTILFLTLSFVVVAVSFGAPAVLRAQDVAVRQAPITGPVAPIVPPLRYLPPVAPVVIPLPPNLPRGNPVGLYPGSSESIVLQQTFFPQLVRAAGIIFSGRVTFVGHAALPQGPVPSSTMVTFQVEQAIRRTTPGQMLTIREWSGLWSNGERYRIGERVLLFLYSPSKLGLTSPVAGAMGRFAVDSQGGVVMDPQHIATFVGDSILGGKTIVPYADFARAVWHASGEE
jgi:hypothetical protein